MRDPQALGGWLSETGPGREHQRRQDLQALAAPCALGWEIRRGGACVPWGGGDRVPESAWLGRARRVQGRRRRESWRFMDPSLILDKLSLGRDGGLAGLGDEKIRASGLADHGSLFIQAGMYRAHWTVPIITGPRADVTGTHTTVQPARGQVWGRRPAGSNIPTKVPCR